MSVYIGQNNLSKLIPKLYIGINDNSKQISKGYIGINEQSKLFYKKNEKHELPLEYTELQYITNTEQSYIITNLYGVNTIECNFKVIPANSYTKNCGIFSYYEENHFFGAYTTSRDTGTGTINIQINYDAYGSGINYTLEDKHEILYKIEPDYTFKFDNANPWQRSKDWNYSKTNPLVIFGKYIANLSNNPDDSIITNGYIRLYSFKVYSDSKRNNLISSFIPAISSNSIIGLYDLVNGIFYTNSGSGSGFIAGPEV